MGIYTYLIIFLISIFGIALHDNDFAFGDISASVILVLFFFICYFINLTILSLKGKNILTIEFFFVGFFSLFHFSYVVLYFLGFSEYDNEVFYDHSSLEKAIYYSLACVCFFVIVYRLFGLKGSIVSDSFTLQGVYQGKSYERYMGIVYSFSKLFIVLSLLLFWIPVIPVYDIVFSEYKNLISIGEISPLGKFFWLGQYIGYASVSLYLSAKCQTGKKINSGFSSFLLYLYMGSFLITGDRGGFISYLFIFIFSYVIYEKNISLRKVAFFAIALLVLSSVIAAGRSQSIMNPLDMLLYYMEGGSGSSSIIDALNEFGISIKTVVISIYLVPSKYDFWYGSSFIDSFLIVFPNFFSHRVSSGIGVFVTEAAFGPIDSTHGRGGSIAMEAYLNFWYFGVLLFAVYGLYLRIIFSRLITRPSIIRSVVLLSSIGAFSMWMRNTSGATFRIIIWSVLISYIVIYIAKKISRKI